MAICPLEEPRSLIWLWSYENDPNTTFWGTEDAGFIWFNRNAALFKYWDGLAIQIVGASLMGTSIASNPGSGEYRIKYIRLDAAGKLVFVYDGTPMP